jgi:hypothetical protein
VFDGRDRLARSCPDRRVLVGIRIAWSKHGLRPVKSRNSSLKNPSKQEAAADLRASHGSASGHVSPYQFLANACIPACLGAARPSIRLLVAGSTSSSSSTIRIVSPPREEACIGRSQNVRSAVASHVLGRGARRHKFPHGVPRLSPFEESVKDESYGGQSPLSKVYIAGRLSLNSLSLGFKKVFYFLQLADKLFDFCNRWSANPLNEWH